MKKTILMAYILPFECFLAEIGPTTFELRMTQDLVFCDFFISLNNLEGFYRNMELGASLYTYSRFDAKFLFIGHDGEVTETTTEEALIQRCCRLRHYGKIMCMGFSLPAEKYRKLRSNSCAFQVIFTHEKIENVVFRTEPIYWSHSQRKIANRIMKLEYYKKLQLDLIHRLRRLFIFDGLEAFGTRLDSALAALRLKVLQESDIPPADCRASGVDGSYSFLLKLLFPTGSPGFQHHHLSNADHLPAHGPSEGQSRTSNRFFHRNLLTFFKKLRRFLNEADITTDIFISRFCNEFEGLAFSLYPREVSSTKHILSYFQVPQKETIVETSSWITIFVTDLLEQLLWYLVHGLDKARPRCIVLVGSFNKKAEYVPKDGLRLRMEVPSWMMASAVGKKVHLRFVDTDGQREFTVLNSIISGSVSSVSCSFNGRVLVVEVYHKSLIMEFVANLRYLKLVKYTADGKAIAYRLRLR
jgi:hypothetical protein